jgi:hypothetical protein
MGLAKHDVTHRLQHLSRYRRQYLFCNADL